MQGAETETSWYSSLFKLPIDGIFLRNELGAYNDSFTFVHPATAGIRVPEAAIKVLGGCDSPKLTQ